MASSKPTLRSRLTPVQSTKISWSSRSVFGRLTGALSRREKVVVAALLSVVLIAGSIALWQRFRSSSFVRGGTYTEGIVASSLADVEPTIQALTFASILKASPSGELIGSLADSWTMSDDARTVEIQLKSLVDRSVVLKAIDPSVSESPFANTTTEEFGDHGIRITLKDPFSPFPETLTKPIVPIGPFIVSDRSKEKITLVARPDYFEGEPNLQSVIVQIFPTTQSLQLALDHHTIGGIASVTKDLKLPENFIGYQLQLPRKTATFFNLDKEPLKDLATRQKLVERKSFDQPLKLDVVTTDTLASTDSVQKLLNEWRQANVVVTLKALPASKVLKDSIPGRNYDVLIFGIDFGADPDPYPFWHSTQRGSAGLNLSNFANVDADHLVESARKTGKVGDRVKLYDQFNAILDEQKPWFVIDTPSLDFAIDRSIRGPASAIGFTATDRFNTIGDWHK